MSEEKKKGLQSQPIYQVIGYLDAHAPFPIGSVLLGAASGAFLLNPKIIPEIPDVLPLIGNLDETAAAFLLLWCGGNVVRWWRIRRAQRKAQRAHKEEP